MTYLFSSFRGEEIEAEFRTEAVPADYGVPDSPQWLEPADDVEILSLSILGINVDPTTLPPEVQTALAELADEWEPDT